MDRIYLNNAACAFPLAPGVVEAVAGSLSGPPQSSGRTSHGSCSDLERWRENTARLLGVLPSEVVYTPGATYGLNTAILGLGLARGDLVVATVMEHNSVLRPLARLEDLFGVRVECVPMTDELRLDLSVFDRWLEKKPRLVVMSHASNVTGRIHPVRWWFERAKSVGAVTLLDASQTVGRVRVRPREVFADIAAFSGYKGLRGPPGTGALYVSSEVTVDPTFVGGTGALSDRRLQPEDMPMRLEAGTPNVAGLAGLDAAASYCMENLNEHAAMEEAITRTLLTGLGAIPGVRVFDSDPSERLPIVSFVIDGMDSESVGFALSECFDIECRAGLHCAPLFHRAIGADLGTVRFSPSYANTTAELDAALDAVRRIAHESY